MIAEASLDDVLAVLSRVPELAQGRTRETYAQRLHGRPALLLVALAAGEAVGFKVGYALDAQVFYSWIGGVVPGQRGRGIAQALLEAQQQWARAQGFACIEVKSSARFPSMLALLERNGYRRLDEEGGKLRFGKVLAAA
ncbi:MAG: Acetyltransferase YpeA [Stenotrophomonas maltophilia]|uniref:Acetyltransferase YpeA n=1 Tax=Stenotrophomonas maltophilia TaxID=40324 RepID=A0A7V8FIG1_STEMA|nr:MAG: Acetyltransferase YpeA [Stenotrophomonas maltophilia]